MKPEYLQLPDEVIRFMHSLRNATKNLVQWDKSAQHVTKKNREPKKFTPDGRMIGDIGEVLAERFFAIQLEKNQKAGYDAVLEDDHNVRVEIKITRSDVFQFRKIPDRVITLELDELNHRIEVVYNGEGQTLVEKIAALQKAEQLDRHWTLGKAVNVKPADLRLLPKSERGTAIPLRPGVSFMD